jgi:tetratricopeptide (TPR) repeat protein
MEEYNEAIAAYKNALTLPSDTLKIYTAIGTCYYNIGAEIEEKARTISDNYRYLREKEKSAVAFESAVQWFEKAYEMNPHHRETITKLYDLYNVLDKTEKMRMLEPALH